MLGLVLWMVLLFVSGNLLPTVHALPPSRPRWNTPHIVPHDTILSHSTKKNEQLPKLILIGGCTGTGKSTFGMKVALDNQILRCISSDTVRAVMRSFISPALSPALHRSSYSVASLEDNAVTSWRETCTVLEQSLEGLVEDAIQRGVSLVVEGVHLVPNNVLLDKWRNAGGIAVGCLLTIPDRSYHQSLLYKRAEMTKRSETKKLQALDRIVAIQDEMVRLAKQHDWLVVPQHPLPEPLDWVTERLERDKDRAQSVSKEAVRQESSTVSKASEERAPLGGETTIPANNETPIESDTTKDTVGGGGQNTATTTTTVLERTVAPLSPTSRQSQHDGYDPATGSSTATPERTLPSSSQPRPPQQQANPASTIGPRFAIPQPEPWRRLPEASASTGQKKPTVIRNEAPQTTKQRSGQLGLEEPGSPAGSDTSDRRTGNSAPPSLRDLFGLRSQV